MAPKQPAQSEDVNLERRGFMQQAMAAATATCLLPSLLGCETAPALTALHSTGGEVMDQALEMMSGLAPLTNHGPMAAEALVALGRTDRVIPWVEGYKKRFTAGHPEPRKALTQNNWREALGDNGRVTDWALFFDRELKDAPWPQVLAQWSAVLAPGLAAAAAHGLIRTAHAVRSLSIKETGLRRRELAQGLAYWSAYYQPLPEVSDPKAARFKPAQAVNQIPLLPVEKRGGGSIMIGLRALNEFPPFTRAADLIEVKDNGETLLSELTETFATAYLKNVNQRNVITLVHTVTGLTALRSLLPYLPSATTRIALRYAWQVAAGLYSISAIGSANSVSQAKDIKRENLIDRAGASQDEHAIKFTEACLREYELNPKSIYLQSAADALARL